MQAFRCGKLPHLPLLGKITPAAAPFLDDTPERGVKGG